MPSTPRPSRLYLVAAAFALLGAALCPPPASAQASQAYEAQWTYGGRAIAAPLPGTQAGAGAQARMRVEEDYYVEAPTPVYPDLLRQRLRNELAARRRLNLQRFIQYRDAGSFPRNHIQQGMLNVFIDGEGHICAAANLMAHDGMLALVQQVAAQNNYLRLADVHDGFFYRWILSSGFTQAEVAMIQEPYEYIEPDVPAEPIREMQEAARLQARFTQILAVLAQQEQRSLDEAVETLLAYRQSHALSLRAHIQPQGDPGGTVAVSQIQPDPLPIRPAPVIVVPAPVEPVQVYAPPAPGWVPSPLVLDASPPGQRLPLSGTGTAVGPQTVTVRVITQ